MLRRSTPDVVRDSGFIFVIAAIPGLERITQYWFGNEEFFRGHSVSFWTVFILTSIATIAWFFSQRRRRLTSRAYLVPVLLITISVYTLTRLIVDDQLFNLKAIALIIVILLITLKPPSFAVATQAAIVMGLFIILAGFLSLFSSAPAVTSSGFNPQALVYGRPLLVFGIDIRWEGPFGNVNYAAVAGGVTILLGVLARGWLRWCIVGAGLAMLLLSQGRAALVAVIAGLLVFALWSSRLQGSRMIKTFRLGVLSVAIVLMAVVLALGDLSGGGRSYIWRDYLEIGTESPVFGIGDPGIAQYVESYEASWVQLGDSWYLLPAFDHGHSIYLDQWARGGAIGLLLVLGVLAAIGYFALRNANQGRPGGLALLVFAAVSGAFETTITWNYLTVLYAPIFAAWILSLETREVGRRETQDAATPDAQGLAPRPPESF